MKQWMRKILVTFIAVITLGIYVPPLDFIADADEKKLSQSTVPNENKAADVTITASEQLVVPDLVDPLEELTETAKNQVSKKLGPKITKQIENEFETIILPKIEKELAFIYAQRDKATLPYLEITENPAAGYGERIFNIYDKKSQAEVAKFHVRRDHRPQDGYWFNFHYHLADDNFETHHLIADVYWDKNTPPKWMAQ